MPMTFKASKTDEYFISIAKQGLHSFIMLGVVVDKQPQLLARVAKKYRSHHMPNACAEPCLMAFSNIKATFSSEPISHRDPTHTRDITYSAYAITYQQTVDLFNYLKKINKQQCLDRAIEDEADQCQSVHLTDLPDGKLSNSVNFDTGYIRVVNQEKNLNKLFYINKQKNVTIDLELNNDRLQDYDAIIQNNTGGAPTLITPTSLKKIAPIVLRDDLMWTYLPKENETENVEFNYGIIVPRMEEEQSESLVGDTLYEDMQAFGRGKPDCRETALAIVNKGRGTTETNVSPQFYKDLPVPTTLVAGQIRQNHPFYILPLPPNAFRPASSDDAVTKQQELLTKLYRRMEDIITLEPDSPKTVEKFNKLKALYEQQAPKTYDKPEDIIASIIEWRNKEENHHVFELRKTYFFDWFITRESATTKMFDEFEQTARLM